MLLPDTRTVDSSTLQILGSPIFPSGNGLAALAKRNTFNNFAKNLLKVSAHQAFFMLKNALYIPKLNYLLRTVDWRQSLNELNSLDAGLCTLLEEICNIHLSDVDWFHASLPVKFGGFGVRKCSDVCTPAYLSSFFASRKLISEVLNSSFEPQLIAFEDKLLESWKLPLPSDLHKQSCWDQVACKAIYSTLLKTVTN